MNVVVTARCYGGTFHLFGERFARERGIDVRWVRDPLDLGEWASKIDGRTRFVYGEMPSNPGLSVFDIAAVADLAHAGGAPLIVDSTIATPALMRPLRHGADIVVHSLSKAMGGSGMAIAGAIVSRRDIPTQVGPDELRADFATYVKFLPARDHGPALNSLSALMILNDVRTLRAADGRVEPLGDDGGALPGAATRPSQRSPIPASPARTATRSPLATCGSWTATRTACPSTATGR